MGGNMSWPRFRGRNTLLHRPNYFTRDERAPAAPDACAACGDNASERHKWEAYLSGEIDRMVYGWWLTEPFQAAVAQAVGIEQVQVAAVMDLMLNADTLWNGDLHKQAQWRGLP